MSDVEGDRDLRLVLLAASAWLHEHDGSMQGHHADLADATLDPAEVADAILAVAAR